MLLKACARLCAFCLAVFCVMAITFLYCSIAAGRSSAPLLVGAEVHVAVGVGRIDGHRRAKMRHRCVHFSSLRKACANTSSATQLLGFACSACVSSATTCHHDQIVIAPAVQLTARDNRQRQQDRDTDSPLPGGAMRRCSAKSRQQPADHEEQSDERQIGVAIGHRLHAHLHEADHGHQGSQEPQPPDQQVAMASAERDRHGRNRQPAEAVTSLPATCRQRIAGMRVENGQVRRPEGFSQVARVGNDGILDAHRNGCQWGPVIAPDSYCARTVMIALATDSASRGSLLQQQPGESFAGRTVRLVRGRDGRAKHASAAASNPTAAAQTAA